MSWKKKEGGCFSGWKGQADARADHSSFLFSTNVKETREVEESLFFVCVCFESMAVDGEDDDRRERNSCCSTEQ